jgi:hypothetical protein
LIVCALAAVFACKINTELEQPVAIEVTLPDSGRVEMSDTFRPSGRGLNGVGDSVQAQLSWSSLDTATLAVLDSATGVSISKALGTARLEARIGTLFSNPQTVTVLARLDSLRAAGATRDTVVLTPVPPVTAADSLSDSLRVQAYALGGAIPANRRVVYVMTIFPDSGSVLTLVPKDTVFTNAAGVASTRLRLRTGPVPDSVVVTATMRHVNGTVVPDRVTFVVEFRP